MIAAMAAAIWLTNLLLDAQTARNSVFPEGADSPVIAVGFLAMSAALDHLLLYEGCPLRGLCPCLVSLAVALGPALCDACGGLREGHATWIPGQEYPTQAELDRELELMRLELAQATTPMVQWRLSLARAEGIRFDVFKTVAMNESSQSWLSSLLCRRLSPTLSFFVRVCRANRPNDFIVAGLGLHSFCQFDFFQVSTHIHT